MLEENMSQPNAKASCMIKYSSQTAGGVLRSRAGRNFTCWEVMGHQVLGSHSMHYYS